MLLGALPADAADYALVANCYCSKVGKIDIATNSLLEELPVADSIGVPVPNITNIAVDTIHNWAYVSDHLANALSIIDLNSWTTTGPIIPAGMGKQPVGLTLNSACSRLYIATYGPDGFEDASDPLEVYDVVGTTFPPTLTRVASVPVGKHPINVALSRDERYVLITCRNQACFTVVSTDSNKTVYTRNYPNVNYEPEGVDIHPIANLAYIFSHGQNQFDVFDFDSLKVVKTVAVTNPIPPQPSGGAFSPDGGRLLVCGQTVGRVFAFNSGDPRNPIQIPVSIQVGPQPHMPLFISDTVAYVPNTNNTQPVGSVAIVSVGNAPALLGMVTGTFHGPLGMALVREKVAPVQARPVYITLVSHNEEPGSGHPDYVGDHDFYLLNREQVRQLALIVKSKGAMWNFQSDWNFLQAASAYDAGAVTANTNGKNVVKWLVEDMGFEADPHAHETQYNYADVAYLHEALGVTPSKNVGGFLYDPPDNYQGWEQHEQGTYGSNYPGYFWKPDNLWGAATYLHLGNDDCSYGVWKPTDKYNFYIHDPSKNLAYIGGGGGNFAGLKQILQALDNHTVADTGFYTVTIFIPQSELNPVTVQGYSDIIDSVSVYVAQNRVVWRSLTQMGELWRTDFQSTPWRVGCADLVGGCCAGRVGDANHSGDDEPTIGDVSVMIDAKFIAGTCDGVITCLNEADINQSGGIAPTCDDITIGDISTLIDYLFIMGQGLGLPNCL